MTAMTVLGISLALGLPWLSGWLLLRAVVRLADEPSAHHSLLLGSAFFVGQLLLAAGLWLSNRLLDEWSIWPPIAVFFGVALTASLAGNRRPRSGTSAAGQAPDWLDARGISAERPEQGTKLLWIFLGLCALHLLFTAVEILHRPVFPWDGWLNWMYRAKAWFHADQWLGFDTPGVWLSGVRENAYAVAGNHYPPLLPLTAVWMALTSGGWSETLINLPTLCAGLAIALMVYGLGRETGLPRSHAAAGAYLLLSLPLLGAHLSLAGMADIWMAGYTGGGFALLFCGLLRERSLWVWLGLAFVAASRMVKLEGSVWFLAALLTVALVHRPRWTLAIAALSALAAGIALTLGIDHVDLPALGTLGIVDGRLQVPLIGSYALADWELLDDYRDNFLRGGSWHLLWPALAVVLLLLLRFRQRRLAGTIGAALLALAAAVAGIFQFTENGAWAEDWSAINRLPLHFSPFLALALAAGVQRLGGVSLQPRRASLILPALVTAITLGAVFWQLTSAASRGETGTGREIDASALTAVIGSVTTTDDGALEYASFQDGIAVVTTGPISFDADSATLATVSSAGKNQEAFNFFWRNDAAPGELHSAFIDRRGDVTVDLGDNDDWRGTILEIGITAFDDGQSLRLQRIVIAPNNAAAQRRKALADWLTPNTWSQRSVNWVDAGSATTQVSLPMLLALAVATMALVIALLPGDRRRRALGPGLSVALLVWLLLDARWLTSRGLLSLETAADYPLVSARALVFGGDQRVYSSVEAARAVIDDSQSRRARGDAPPLVLVGSENPADLFQRLRARYHLLPLAGLEIPGPGAGMQVPAGHALVLKSGFRRPGEADQVAEAWRSGLEGRGNWSTRKQDGNMLLLSAGRSR